MELAITEALSDDLSAAAALIAGDEAPVRYGIDLTEAERLLNNAENSLSAHRWAAEILSDRIYSGRRSRRTGFAVE